MAVEKLIQECIESGVLAEFLLNNRTEAKNVSIFEYDEEKHMRQTKEEGRKEGREEGRIEERQEMILELLSEYGELPEKLENDVKGQEDYEILRYWSRLAAKAASVEEFEKAIHVEPTDGREERKEF